MSSSPVDTSPALQPAAAPLAACAAALDELCAAATRANAPFFVRDLGGRFVVANAAYAEPAGFVPDALIGRTLVELFGPEAAATMADEDRHVIAARVPLVLPLSLTVDGAPRHFLLTKYPLLSEDGAVIGVVGIATDVTGYEPAAPSDYATEHPSFAFDQAPIGAALLGLDLRYLRVNQALCRLTGYDQEALLASDSLAYAHPADLRAELHAVMALASGATDEVAIEKRYLQPDGGTVWANLHLRLLRGAAGESGAYLAFVEDISAQKATLASIERGERIQRAVAACSQRLVANTTDAEAERRALSEALRHLCDGVSMLRVNLWENYAHPQDGFSFRLYARAATSPEHFLSESGTVLAHAPWSAFPAAYVHALQAGEPSGGPVEILFRDAPTALQLAREAGLGSLQAFPITVDGRWWGKLLFNDREAREWDAQEVLLLRTAAAIIGSFLQRNRDVVALRERDAMLRALGDNLPDAFIYQIEELPGGQLRRTYMSRGLERRTGVSAERALANIDELALIMHPDDVAAYEAAKARAMTNFAPYAFEHRYLAADGSVRWVNARSSPRLADGRKLWDGIVFDTTGLKQLQEELRLANQGLNRRVDELSLLNQVSHLLSDVTNLTATLELVCRRLCDAFGALEAMVALRTSATEAYSVVARHTLDAEPAAAPPGVIDATIAAEVLRHGHLLVEADPRTDQSVLVVAMRAQRELIGLLQLRIDHELQPVTPDTVSLVQTIAGAIAGAVVTARLYEQAVHNGERLERLNAASRMINSAGLDLSILYGAIHQAVTHLLPVEAFVISLVEPGSELVTHVFVNDSRVDGASQARVQVPLGQSFAGFIRRYGPSLRVDDFEAFYARHPEVAFAVFGDEEDTRSGLAASFVTADGLYGLLFAQCYPPGAYTDDDLLILELLAAHAATAIENARRAQRARRDAIDEERNRLARDLHDSVTQSLFSASLIAERLPATARRNPEDAWAGLDLLHHLVRNSLTEMRALLIELRPAALANAPLHLAIERLANSFSSRRNLPIALNLAPAPPLPLEVQVALYRIVQECLSNVLKHAQARSATVEMLVEPAAEGGDRAWSGTITIRVADDGRGFQIERQESERLGLGIMRERAASIGATLSVASEPGTGTRVALIWHGKSTGEEP